MNKISLTTNEIGILWTQYIQTSMSVQVLRAFLATVEDDDIKRIVTEALAMSEDINQSCRSFFEQENLPIPNGYDQRDVDLEAPKLFTDSFMLSFIENMGKVGMASDGISLGFSTREDTRDYFTEKSQDTMKLYNDCINVSLSKGLYVRAPQIEVENKVEYVEGQKYLSPFQKRSLNTIEITHLFENIKTNAIGEMLCAAFAQTTQSEEVQDYMRKGMKISKKHHQFFANCLSDSNIHPPMESSSSITNSTVPVFSDRLMMFLMSVMSAAGQANYSSASTASLRYDLIFNYQRLSVEIALFAKDGLDMMIKNGWFEEPPQAPNRNKMSK